MADEDLQLVERFQHGDISAFDELLAKYQSKVYDVVYCHVRNVEDAYDLSQEVFFRAFKALGKFKKKSSFYTWLYRIAINACIDYGRQKSRVHIVPIEEWIQICDSVDPQNTDSSFSPVRALELQELRYQISKAIDQLPPKQRAVFILKRREGLTLEEIAGVMGRSVGTVKAHLSHATSKLTDLLSSYLEK